MSADHLAQILSPPVKRTLADEVVERLRRAILGGQLAPDEQLRENQLAEFMNVSRGPIREALHRLEREGLVINRSNGRSYVARLSRQDAEEVYSLRRALELLAVRCACEKATPADVAEMQAVIDDMAGYVQRDVSEQEAAELDVRFHDVLYRVAGHQRLLSYWMTLRPQIHVFLLSRNVASSDFRESAARGHQAILDAIATHDEAQALTEIEAHLDWGYARVIGSYGSNGNHQA